MTYEISITSVTQPAGAEPLYAVSVIPPGEMSAPTAKMHERELVPVLEEVLSPSSPNQIREHLKKAYSVDGDRIEIPSLSDAHIKQLRGLGQKTAAR